MLSVSNAQILFVSDFESSEGVVPGSLNSQSGWEFSSSVVVDTFSPYSGLQHVWLPFGDNPTELSITSNSALSNTIVYLDFYLSPNVASSLDKLSADFNYSSVAATGIVNTGNGLGELYITHGDGSQSASWQPTGRYIPLLGNISPDYHWFVYELNYGSKVYSLFLDGILVANNISFLDSGLTEFTKLKLSSDGKDDVYFDHLTISYDEPSGLDHDGDGILSSLEDSNKNGIVDNGETDFMSSDTDDDNMGDAVEILYGFDPLISNTYAALAPDANGSLSWETSFEMNEGITVGNLNNQSGWQANEMAQIVGSAAFDGAQSMQLTSGSLPPLDSSAIVKQYFGTEGNKQIWVSFYGKLSTGSLPDVTNFDVNSSGTFKLDSIGRLAALDNFHDQWLVDGSMFDPDFINDGNWKHYVVHLDYLRRQWSLIVEKGMVFKDIPFGLEAPNEFSLLKITQASPAVKETWIDKLTVSDVEPEGLDFDLDGLENNVERQLGSDVFSFDSDSDNIDDFWEYTNGWNLLDGSDALSDLDGDARTLLEEYQAGTDPSSADFDGDGYDDLFEYILGLDAYVPDEPVASSDLNGWTVNPISSSLAKAISTTDKFVLVSNGKGFSTHWDDSLGYLHKQVEGNFEFTAKVEFPENTSQYWQAGIILREGINPKAAMVGVFISGDGTIYQHDRGEFGGKVQTVSDAISKTPLKSWLKIKRHGNSVSLFTSSDGSLWQLFYTATMSLADSVNCGFAVTSALPGVTAGASFSDFSFDFDRDNDGIVASLETLLESSDDSADSDSDGYSDYREKYEFHSDPTVADLNTPITLHEFRGRDSIVKSGEWIGFGSGRYADTIRGSLEFPVNISEAGILQLGVAAGFTINDTYDPVFEIDVDLDGEYIGTLNYDVGNTEVELENLLLPWLNPGDHSIRLTLTNTYLFRKIFIESLKLQTVGGPDGDGDGLPDWVSTRLEQNNTIETVFESNTSPVCLTGTALFTEFTRVNQGTVTPGPDYQWFANLELVENDVTPIEVSHENNAFESDFGVTWIPTNVLTASNLTVRKGDSLKLIAQPENYDPLVNSKILVDEAVVFEGLSSDHAIYQFNEIGTFAVRALYSPLSDFIENTITVTVVAGEFNGNPLAVAQQARTWDGSILAPELSIDSDSRLAFERSSSSGSNYNFKLRTDTIRDRYIWARLGHEGPVVATSTVRGLQVATAASSGIFLEESYQDGTSSVRMPIVASRVADDMKIALDVFVGGVLFENGSTYKELFSGDFDSMGIAFVRFYKTGDVSATCHTTKLYQNSTYIGKNR